MTIHSTVSMVSMAAALTLAAAAPLAAQTRADDGTTPHGAAAKPGPRRAPTVEAEMRRTGQVAAPDLHGEQTSILRPTVLSPRAETKVRFVPAAPPRVTTPLQLKDDTVLSSEYGAEFASEVEDCRFDVARSWGKSATEVLAGSITLRWTIEPTGRVHDVAVTASTLTDEDVMTCAKTVVARWTILNPVKKAQALEWTHAFRQIGAPPLLASREVLSDAR